MSEEASDLIGKWVYSRVIPNKVSPVLVRNVRSSRSIEVAPNGGNLAYVVPITATQDDFILAHEIRYPVCGWPTVQLAPTDVSFA